jgi:hypothetical protein
LYVISPNATVPLAADADPDSAATEALIAWSVDVKEALKLDIGKADEPLILVTNTFLASDADPLNVATEALIAWSVDVNDPLSVAIGAVDEPLILVTNTSLAVDADPLSVDIGEVDEPLT